jgi:hypothetical protein
MKTASKYFPFTLIAFILLCSIMQNAISQVESFPKESPRLIFKPEIVIPDSLLPLQKDVKVLVQVFVDTSGIPTSLKVVRSSDKRFNKVAKELALQYRFDAKSELDFYKIKELSISFPIVFIKK